MLNDIFSKVNFIVAFSLWIDWKESQIRHLSQEIVWNTYYYYVFENLLFSCFTFSTYFSIKLKNQLFVALYINIGNAFANNIALCATDCTYSMQFAMETNFWFVFLVSVIFQFRNKMAHKRISESLLGVCYIRRFTETTYENDNSS